MNLNYSEIPVQNFPTDLMARYVRLLKWNSFPECIMEVGIGDGRVSKAAVWPVLPKEIEDFIGCDISESALDFSKGIINNDKYRTIRMDLTADNIPHSLRNRCHHVISNFCLHMIQKSR